MLPQGIVGEDAVDDRVAGAVEPGADRLKATAREHGPARRRVFPKMAVGRDGEDVVVARGVGRGAGRKNSPRRREVAPGIGAEQRTVLPQRVVGQYGEHNGVAGEVGGGVICWNEPGERKVHPDGVCSHR